MNKHLKTKQIVEFTHPPTYSGHLLVVNLRHLVKDSWEPHLNRKAQILPE